MCDTQLPFFCNKCNFPIACEHFELFAAYMEVEQPATQGNAAEQNGTTADGYGSIQPQETSFTASPEKKAAARVLAPDLLRGLLMILQSIDHSALAFGVWQHGTARVAEADGTPVDSWNSPGAWLARTLTHLCAPGFMFLLGMGVVYFGRSRSRLGWTTRQMAWHFFARALALALVNELLGLLIGRGRFLILNIVLLALAVNYLLAGLLWLAVNASEKMLADLIGSSPLRKEDEQPLLRSSSEDLRPKTPSSRAVSISWHLHNLLLLILAAVSIWWNIWISPDHGHCGPETSPTPGNASSIHASAPAPTTTAGASSLVSAWFGFWFYPTSTPLVMSPFPPLAWLSFAILGLLYGRIATARAWPRASVNGCNLLAGALFALLFVATRLLHFGNLSERCLHMPEQGAGAGNQYLASGRSFLYVVKYPPSVAFLAFTMSANFLLLALFGALPAGWARRIPTLMVFGTSALFFYVVHIVLYGGLAMVVKPLFGRVQDFPDMEDPSKPAFGVGNTRVYWVAWLLGLAILYPLCAAYGRFKSLKGPDSIWRFF